MTLHEQRNVLQTAIDKATEDLTDMLVYLGSDKFQGDGNNFVNSDEMFVRILRIRSRLDLNSVIDTSETGGFSSTANPGGRARF